MLDLEMTYFIATSVKWKNIIHELTSKAKVGLKIVLFSKTSVNWKTLLMN